MVIHKSTTFNPDELDGFVDVVLSERIESHDFLSFSLSHARPFRAGNGPPFRGFAGNRRGEYPLRGQGRPDAHRV
jgi:hypothetical protein